MRTRNKLDNAIKNSLRNRKEPVSAAKLAEALNEETPRVWERLRSLVRSGLVETTQTIYNPARADSGSRYRWRKEA